MTPREHDPSTASGDEEQEEAEMQEEQIGTRRSSRRNKRMRMGEDSGLTDAERRQLRRDQRDIAKQLQEGPTGTVVNEDDEDHDEEEPRVVDEDFLFKARKKNNELFDKVRFTREAVLDAENVDTIASKFVKKTDGLISSSRYDEMKFVSKLKSKLLARDESSGSQFFDWGVLGREAGVCYSAAPCRVSFLVGPLANVKLPEKRKARTVRQSQKKSQAEEEEEVEEESPEQMGKQKKEADRLSAAERAVKTMRTTLSKRSEEKWHENRATYNEVKKSQPDDAKMAKQQLQERGREVDFVPFLVNPQSFTQTVENIFNFSFLVKKGEAKIKMRDGDTEPLGDQLEDNNNNDNALKLPTSGCFVQITNDEEADCETKQCVLSFSMRDWRDLCEAYDLEKCDIPHRKGTKQKATNFSQQAMSEDEEDEEMEEMQEADVEVED